MSGRGEKGDIGIAQTSRSMVKVLGLQPPEPGFDLSLRWGSHCEYEVLTIILTSTAPTSLRLRRSTEQDGQMPESKKRK